MRCNGYDGEKISPANDRVSAAGVRRVEFLITGVRCKRASGLSENGEGTGLRKEYREILNGGAEDGNDWERGKGGVRYTMRSSLSLGNLLPVGLGLLFFGGRRSAF